MSVARRARYLGPEARRRRLDANSGRGRRGAQRDSGPAHRLQLGTHSFGALGGDSRASEFLDASANQLTDVKDACAFCGSVPELMELNLKGERARRAARPRASCAALTHPPPACARNRESYHEDPQVQGQYYRYVVDKYAKTRLRAHKLRTADQPSRAADMLDGKPVREQERDFLVAMQAKRRKRGKKSASGKGSARSGPSFQISAVDRQ